MTATGAQSVPANLRKVICHKLSSNFAEATKTVTEPIPNLKPTQILIKNRFVGINASDINFTAGRYFSGAETPFDTGFEGVGTVVAVGSDVQKITVGTSVAYMEFGAFTEYKILEAEKAIPVPAVKKEYIPLMVSGLTASLALDFVGEIKSTDTVLVTAAAGGTGQFAVQWAKSKGCRVLGTCSSADKIEFLKKIGCDRPINYKTENLHEVLQKECPNGVDVVYESVGGQIFDTCVANLATFGRLIIIGSIEGYKSGRIGESSGLTTLPSQLLVKSASVRGFFLFHFKEHVPKYLTSLIKSFETGSLKSFVDQGESTKRPFVGVDDVGRAVEYLHSAQSIGKVVVEIGEQLGTTHL
jgi:NADPH-dependent curcumin reductase CurA